MASRNVVSLRPSANTIGSAKRRHQDKTQLRDRNPDLSHHWPVRSAPSPRSLNAVVDLFYAGSDGLLACAKFYRTLDSSTRGINDPAPPARLDLFNVVINRPMLHGSVPVLKNGAPAYSKNALAVSWFGNRLTD